MIWKDILEIPGLDMVLDLPSRSGSRAKGAPLLIHNGLIHGFHDITFRTKTACMRMEKISEIGFER
jgi:hypothetical protein